MNENARRWAKPLLWLHLFVCVVWLYLFRVQHQPPDWTLHVFAWSILGVQFTWGFTVGLLIGPGRQRRPLLWSSLLTLFMPLYLVGPVCQIIAFHNPLLALMYFAICVMILACETYCGVMLGAKMHRSEE